MALIDGSKLNNRNYLLEGYWKYKDDPSNRRIFLIFARSLQKMGIKVLGLEANIICCSELSPLRDENKIANLVGGTIFNRYSYSCYDEASYERE